MKFIAKFWWIGVISVIALGAVVFLYNPKPTPAVFDFNDGTTQGWTFVGVYDDAGKQYNGTAFPPSMLMNFQGKQLVFFPNQLGLYLGQKGFPNTSKYWRVDLVSPNLGPAWSGLKGIEASVRDQIGMSNNVLEIKPFVVYAADGKTVTVPAEAAFAPTLPHDKVTLVNAKMKIPSGAKPMKILLRIRGKWATPGSSVIELYEGQVYVDDVTKIL